MLWGGHSFFSDPSKKELIRCIDWCSECTQIPGSNPDIKGTLKTYRDELSKKNNEWEREPSSPEPPLIYMDPSFFLRRIHFIYK